MVATSPSDSIDQEFLHKSGHQFWFYFLAVVCAAIAVLLTILQCYLQRKGKAEFEQELVDANIQRRARKSFRALLYVWVTEPRWRRRAWAAILAATLQQVASEATWAYIISKQAANVTNTVTTLVDTKDVQEVYSAMLQELLWQLCWAVPLWRVALPLVYQLTRLEFQSFLTRTVMESYLDGGGHAYYHVKVAEVKNGIDNPEQRIEQDTTQVAQDLFDVYTALISAIVGPLMWFHVISQIIGGPAALIMVGAASFRTGIAVLGFGKPLVRATQRVMITSASFRYGLTRVRDSAEEIALSDGDKCERIRASGSYDRVVRAIIVSMFVKLRYNLADGLIEHFPHLLLWLTLLGPIQSGSLKFGDAYRAHWGYDQLAKVFQFVVNNFEAFTNLQANMDRIHTLLAACDETNADESCGGGSHIAFEVASVDVALALEGVSVAPPGVDSLVGGVSIVCPAGQAMLIQGESGIGKTSLLRAISRLWRTGSGKISCPGGDSSVFVKFVPNRCYLPVGTLVDIVSYPGENESFQACPFDQKSEAVYEVLRRCGLTYLAERWGMRRTQDWKPLLSPGEAQRLSIARLLLHLQYSARNATLALLDEATGNMDVDMEYRIYLELRRELAPGGGLIGVVSVGHRPTLRDFHETILAIGQPQEETDAGLNTSKPLASGTWIAPGSQQVWRHLRNLSTMPVPGEPRTSPPPSPKAPWRPSSKATQSAASASGGWNEAYKPPARRQTIGSVPDRSLHDAMNPLLSASQLPDGRQQELELGDLS